MMTDFDVPCAVHSFVLQKKKPANVLLLYIIITAVVMFRFTASTNN